MALIPNTDPNWRLRFDSGVGAETYRIIAFDPTSVYRDVWYVCEGELLMVSARDERVTLVHLDDPK